MPDEYSRGDLIFDRSQADIDMVHALIRHNQPLPFDNLKIAWDWRALNRIEFFCAKIAEILRLTGTPVSIVTKTNWTTESENSENDGKRILNNINELRRVAPPISGVPETPASANLLSFIEANAIEKILYALDEATSEIGTIFRRSGTIRAGQVKLYARRT